MLFLSEWASERPVYNIIIAIFLHFTEEKTTLLSPGVKRSAFSPSFNFTIHCTLFVYLFVVVVAAVVFTYAYFLIHIFSFLITPNRLYLLYTFFMCICSPCWLLLLLLCSLCIEWKKKWSERNGKAKSGESLFLRRGGFCFTIYGNGKAMIF